MKISVFFSLVLLVYCSLSVQAQHKSIYRIKIEFWNGLKEKGNLLALNDSTIEINQGNGRGVNKSFQIPQIKAVHIRKKGSGGRGFAIGLGAGALLGAGLGYATHSPCSGCFDLGPGVSAAAAAVVGGLVGALIGAGIGSAYKELPINGDQKLYDQLKHKVMIDD